MQVNGFIVIHRKLLDWEWYDKSATKDVFLHLLLTANHADKKWRGILIKRGQLITSVSHLAKSIGISTQSCRTALTNLKSTNELTIETTNRYTLISINNYDEYQQITNQITNKQQTNNKQTTTNNNDNNENNNNTNVLLASLKTDKRNPLIEKTLQTFTTASGLSKPSDYKPRFAANNLVRSINKIISRYGSVSEDTTSTFIDRYFEWYFSQDFAEKTTKIEALSRQLPKYDRDVVIPHKGKGSV